MLAYVRRRLLLMIPTLFGISLIAFLVIQLPPGDYLTSVLASMADSGITVDEAQMARMRETYGLDDPVYVRYLRWASAMLQGDWGFSFVSRVDADRLILQRLPATLFVIGSAQILALLVALPVGIYAHAGHAGGVDEQRVLVCRAGDAVAGGLDGDAQPFGAGVADGGGDVGGGFRHEHHGRAVVGGEIPRPANVVVGTVIRHNERAHQLRAQVIEGAFLDSRGKWHVNHDVPS